MSSSVRLIFTAVATASKPGKDKDMQYTVPTLQSDSNITFAAWPLRNGTRNDGSDAVPKESNSGWHLSKTR